MSWKSFTQNEYYKISGVYNYHTNVSIKGTAPYNTCTISVNIFSNNSEKFAVAAKFKWFRVRGQREYGLLGVHGNTYQLSASDIGSLIKVQILSQDDDYQGTSVVEFGPVQIEPSQKNTLEQILVAGGSKFNVQFLNDQNKMIGDSGSLLLTNDDIRIICYINSQEEISVKFKYSLDFPILEMNNLDQTKMAFYFKSNEYEDISHIQKFHNQLSNSNNQSKQDIRIQFKFISKTQCDLVTLIVKCFSAKGYLINSKAMGMLEQIFSEGKIFSSEKNGFSGDLLLEVESLKKELFALIEQNKIIYGEKEKQYQEIQQLEDDLSSTIETYSSVIQELKMGGQGSSDKMNESFMQFEQQVAQKKYDKDLRTLLKQTEKENKNYKLQIIQMKEELDLLKNQQSAGFFQESKIFTSTNNVLDNSLWLQKSNISSQKVIDQNYQKLQQKYDKLKEIVQIQESKLRESTDNSILMSSKQTEDSTKNLQKRLKETKQLNDLLIKEVKALKLTQQNSSLIDIEKNKLQIQPEIQKLNDQIIKLQDELQKYKDQAEMEKSFLNQSFFKKNESDQDLNHMMIRNQELQQENQVLLSELDDCKKKIEVLHKNIDKYENEEPTLIQKLSGKKQSNTIEKMISLKESPIKNVILIDQLNEKILQLQEELDFFKNKNVSMMDQSFYNQEQQDLHFKITSLEQLLDDIRKRNEILTKDLKAEKDKQRELNLQIQELKRELIMAKDYNVKDVQVGNLSNSQSLQLESRINCLENENESLIQQNNLITKTNESLKKELEQQDLQQQKQQGGNQRMLDNLIDTNQRLMLENNKLNEEIRQLHEKIEEFEPQGQQITELQEENFILQIQNKDLKEEQNKLSQSKTQLDNLTSSSIKKKLSIFN